MPKSKRNKQVELAKTKKRGLEWKKKLFEEVRSCVDKYANVFVFIVNDMRNSKMKNVRDEWKHSRFFIGKNKIMAMALGRCAEEEYKPNLHKLGQRIKGQRGLLFTNKSVEEVLSWFRSYSEGDYARSGNVATETVSLKAGPLPMFPHYLEPYLRELGLPTSLEKGVIHLVREYEVCKTGDVLTPQTAKILKLLGYEMAEFHISIDCVWSNDSSFTQFTESSDTDEKENKKIKKSSLGTQSNAVTPLDANGSPETEKMDVVSDMEEESNDSDDDIDSASDTRSEINDVPSSETVPIISTPKEKKDDFTESNSALTEEEINKSQDANNDRDVIECKDGDDVVNLEETHVKSPDLNDSSKPNSRKSRARSIAKTPKSVNAKTKRESLMKTPDADTSQESPLFRQLRNRSVKVTKKRK